MQFDRTDPSALRARLKSASSHSKHALGQHFLINREILESIVSAGNIKPGEQVVEIGPGLGVLSEQLLKTGAEITAFELDPQMVSILLEDFPDLRVIGGDVLSMLPEVAPELGEYKIVANIPYQITTPLLRLLLERDIARPTEAILLIQQEVGERLAAGAGKEGRGYLSVLTQYYAEVQYVRSVSASAFWPEPKVASAVVRLVIRPERSLLPEQEQAFLRFVRMYFTQPRKQLRNVVAGIRGISAQQVGELFEHLGLPQNVRAQELSQVDWLRLFKDTPVENEEPLLSS
jgi:16S rRNA (adenine1518-N6/adenine1519-N6)-dimethyltransferase